jgi:hypothetical protein
MQQDLCQVTMVELDQVDICGQAPSAYPEFAAWLVEADIDAISLNPDSIIQGATVHGRSRGAAAPGSDKDSP